MKAEDIIHVLPEQIIGPNKRYATVIMVDKSKQRVLMTLDGDKIIFTPITTDLNKSS